MQRKPWTVHDSSQAGRPEITDAEWIGAARHQLSARLMDSLVHEARNPLNALSINIGVLSQKLRSAEGVVPPAQERNLAAMRDQVSRIDDILKLFNDFMGPRPMVHETDFSLAVNRALSVLGHEVRRAQVKLESELMPKLRTVSDWDEGALSFLAVQPLLRGLARSKAGKLFKVRLTGADGQLIYAVEDGGGPGPEPFDHAVPALQRVAARGGGQALIDGGLLVITLPWVEE